MMMDRVGDEAGRTLGPEAGAGVCLPFTKINKKPLHPNIQQY